MTATDPFINTAKSKQDPAKAIAVTADVEFTTVSRGIYIGGSGDLEVEFKDGTTYVYKNIAQGMHHPIECVKVISTNTTATDIAYCI